MSFFKRKFRGRADFSYKVDYVKAIADDAAAIALAERALLHGWWKPESWEQYHTPITTMVVLHVAQPNVHPEDVAAFTPGEFGLTREDVSCLAYYGDFEDTPNIRAFVAESERVPARYTRGEAAFKKLVGAFGAEIVRTRAQLQSDLKRAKTNRARHRRNQTKYGATA